MSVRLVPERCLCLGGRQTSAHSYCEGTARCPTEHCEFTACFTVSFYNGGECTRFRTVLIFSFGVDCRDFRERFLTEQAAPIDDSYFHTYHTFMPAGPLEFAKQECTAAQPTTDRDRYPYTGRYQISSSMPSTSSPPPSSPPPPSSRSSESDAGRSSEKPPNPSTATF